MKYCIAKNFGEGFVTHQDRETAWLSGHTGDIYAVGDANSTWIQRVNGEEKTLSEAQAIIDQIITDAQNVWDNNNVEKETPEQKLNRMGPRPTSQALPGDAEDSAFVLIK